MAWTTPTLRQIRSRVRDDVTTRLPGADAMVPNSNLRVMSDANAGLALEEHAYLQWLGLQLLPDTAEGEWLERHANIWLRRGRKPATFAQGTVTLTGTAGTILPAGTSLLYGSYEFLTTEELTIGAGATAVIVEARTAGAASSLELGGSLRLSQATVGVDASAAVTAATVGLDEESDDDLRARVLKRIRKPPMGGNKDDYEAWALEVPAVTRAWCAPLEMGIGTVTLRFMMDDLRADAGGFPEAEDVAIVAAYLDTVRPVAVKDMFVVAPIPEPIDFTILNLSSDTSSVRASIERSAKEMLAGRAAPGQTIYQSWISESVSAGTGEDHHNLVFEDHLMPSLGHLAVLGTIAYA
ncbi:baseplate J/gp47 family protein [Kaistia dalseonensis]|uniref:Phage protein gp47/JayE n=1 Tax=Kaistia dalseonensis TaxID=410840 RepID=A0ABU0HC00_9HYPH|nr:baseplate J/gp47 family protein [Kaistia dalseonensis]MCX5496426.1 baseplate J/gp47 family protein [Kaistia dalseonensis]MDQ0439046.1 putative phage protein gp47/JayE [Kaistia dalseonensis]